MSDETDDDTSTAAPEKMRAGVDAAEDRRTLLRKLGRFAGVTAPSVTLLLAAAAKPNRAQAAT